jgi:hypothetical protein
MFKYRYRFRKRKAALADSVEEGMMSIGDSTKGVDLEVLV